MPSLKQRQFGRRNFLRLLAAGTTGALADAFWIEPNLLTVTRQEILCRKLPAGLDGMRIGLLADFHFQPDRNESLVEEAVERVNAEKLDLLMLAGDFVTANREVLPPLVKLLEKASTRHGVFAVLGNHDGWNMSRSFARRTFEKAGISFLINHNSHLQIGGESLAIAGTDFVWLGKPDPEAALKGIRADRAVIALVHEPDYFDVMRGKREIALQVSGHTHGGQCRVPLVGHAPVTVQHGRKYIYGHHGKDGSNLFVTRGVGTTGLRVRFACPPELAVLTLRARDAG